ncbi:hypothetical protein SLA2020_278270 [Shorea laevis]
MATFLTSSSPLAAFSHSKVRSTNCHFNTYAPLKLNDHLLSLVASRLQSHAQSLNRKHCKVSKAHIKAAVYDESTVTPQTKFADLGADSLDIVEIMMALEEKFEVAIGEGGAENISTVQDAADLVEKVKAASSA